MRNVITLLDSFLHLSWLKVKKSIQTIPLTILLLCSINYLSAQVSVTATAGTMGPTSYTTLNSAFTAINNGTHQGVIDISITGNTTEPGTPVPLLKSASPSNYSSISIKPSGGNWIINSAAVPTASRGVIELNGADNVTIDGDDPSTSGTQNLTIQAATSTTTGIACVRFASTSTTGTDGADNNILKNCILIGSRSSATSTVVNYGFVMSNSSLITTGAYSSLNTLIENNVIYRCYHGINLSGSSSTYPNTGTQVLNNTIGNATDANAVGFRGILITYSSISSGSAILSGNNIRVGVSTTGYNATVAGIEVGISNYGISIRKNNIHDIIQPVSGGFGAHGIYITGSANNTLSYIENNFIKDCKMVAYQTSSTSPFIPCGVFLTAGATGINFRNNTVVMGAQLASGNLSSFAINASVSGVVFATFQNNILVNTHSSTYAFCFFTSATGNISGGTVNNNNYYAPNGNVGYYNSANRVTFSNWQTATGKDANGANVNPPFISASDLHLDIANPTIISFEQKGATGTGITIDIDGELRPNTGTSIPDIGADEVAIPLCSVADGGTISPNSQNKCSGQTVTMASTGATTGTGISYQWKVSSTSGSGYVNVTGGTGATTTSYTSDALSAGTYYYVLETTCSAGPTTDLSNELTVVVNASPTVTVSPASASLCSGGTPITLTAAGANTYAWTPSTGLSATTGDVVTANPTSTITYTVTGTDGNSCTNTATAVITVTTTPSLTAPTATPATICSGDNSQLSAMATVPFTSMAFSTSSGVALETITTPSTITTVSTGTVDDGSNEITPSPAFTFIFKGVNYTGFSASTNGWLKMAATAASTTIPSSLINLSSNGIFAFGRDANLNTANGGNITHGPAAGGKYVFQFTNNSGAGSGGTSASIYFTAQIVLWGSGSASPGKIEIIYGSSLGTPASSGSIGVATSSGQYINAVTGNSTALTNATTYPASGTAYVFSPVNITYAWTPSTFLNDPAIFNPLATAVNSTTTYSVTASANGCTSSSQSVTVTVSSGAAITTQPIADTKCAGQTSTFTVAATGPGLTYQWRKDGNNLTNGGTISGANSTALTITGLVTGDAGSYDVIVTSTCGSPLNSDPAILVVYPKPTASASSNSPICAGQTLNLTGTTDASAGATFAWSGPNTFTSTDQNPTIAGATSTASGAYSFTVTSTAGCTSNPATTIVTINLTPSTLIITQGSSVGKCASAPAITLNATGGDLTGLSQVGTGTTTNATTGYPSPFSNYYGGTKHQILIRASELMALGVPANANITSLTFNVFAVGSSFSGNLNNFQIDMANTATNVLSSSSFVGSLTNVRAASTLSVPTSGLPTNLVIPITPFVWNGTDNLLIQTSYSNANSGTTNDFVQMQNSDPGFVSTNWYRVDGQTAAAVLAASTPFSSGNARPNVGISYTSNTTITWSPSTGLFTDAGGTMAYNGTDNAPTIYAAPSSTQSYIATSTSAAGCTVSATINVVIEGTTVTSTADSGSGTLRAAIDCVVDGGTVTTTLTSLMTDPININKNVIIVGTGGGTVEFNFAAPGLTAGNYGLQVAANKTVTLTNVNIIDKNNPDATTPSIKPVLLLETGAAPAGGILIINGSTNITKQ